MVKKVWIRPSTAARLRGVRRQAIYYHIDHHTLKTKNMDGNVYVEQSAVLALKLRKKNLTILKPETSNIELE